MITIFTPSFADEADTNAQNLSVKEIVARLDPQRVAVTMLHEGVVDPRIASRPNTTLLPWHPHGNTVRTIWKILRNVPDVYFYPREGPLDAAFLRLRRLLGLKSAVVCHVVSGGLNSQGYAPSRVRNIRAADAVLANNTYLAHLMKEKLSVEAGVLHNGIDRRHFFPPQPGRAAGAALSVLYAGSFRPYKRVPLVIREAARRPEIRFRIAGTGEEEQACRNLAVELGCRNVEFLGHVSPAVLGDEMRRADIFLFPSNIEGHPQVLGQAAACGLPAIAMRSYHPDFVVDGTTGFLAERDEEMGEKLDVLIRQSELRRSMSEAAIRHAAKFDWDVIAAKWLDILETAVAKRRKN